MEEKRVYPEYEALLVEGFQKWIDTHLSADEQLLCSEELRILLENAWLNGVRSGLTILKIQGIS